MRRIVCTLDRGLQYSKWCIKLSYTCIQSQLSAHEQRQSFFSTRNIEFQRDLPVVRIYHRLQKNLTSQPFPVSLPSAFATAMPVDSLFSTFLFYFFGKHMRSIEKREGHLLNDF